MSANRLRRSRGELVELIMELLPDDGEIEALPFLLANRMSLPVSRDYTLFQPVLCIAVQGTKHLIFGSETYQYDPGHYLLTTVELPIIYATSNVSPENPYLGMRVVLDPSLVASLLMKHGGKMTSSRSELRAMDVGEINAEMLDAALRLLRLVGDRQELEAIAPLIISELIYRLILAGHSSRLSHLIKTGHAQQVLKATDYMRRNFDQPLRVEDLARDLGMSVSGFHHQFKSVTAMSPLQFQKHIRLQEARRLMLSDGMDAAEAGFQVGYSMPSHFSREYKSFFGEPPQRDIAKIRHDLGGSTN